MIINIENGWLLPVRRLASPNADTRPEGATPDLIVVHCISLPPGQFGGDAIDRLFTNRLDPKAHPYFETIHQLRVSAHALIRRDGGITQYVPFGQRAWHAGVSSYQGHTCCNDFSIGIELEGTEVTAYTNDQYQQLARLIKTLVQHYPTLSYERITGHSNIAPGRKQDPGPAFDWSRLDRLIGI